MSRAADVKHGSWVTLPGDCQCPGKPHPEGDRVKLRNEGGYGVISAITMAGYKDSGGEFYNYGEARIMLVRLFLLEWDLLDNDGEAIPADEQGLRLLSEEDLEFLAAACDDRIRRAPPVPNGSGAPSADSPQGAPSPTPETAPAPS